MRLTLGMGPNLNMKFIYVLCSFIHNSLKHIAVLTATHYMRAGVEVSTEHHVKTSASEFEALWISNIQPIYLFEYIS